MNNEKIIKNIMEFIEEEERELQAASLTPKGKKLESEIVGKILNMLDQEIKNED